MTNAARNAPVLLVNCCSCSTCCHQGVSPGSTRASLLAPSSCWQCCRYCGPTSTLAQSAVKLQRRREAGKRGVVFLGNRRTWLVWVSLTAIIILPCLLLLTSESLLVWKWVWLPALLSHWWEGRSCTPASLASAALGGWSNCFLSCACSLVCSTEEWSLPCCVLLNYPAI